MRLSPAPLLVLALATGCERLRYDPTRATEPYPFEQHQANSIDVQVFRKGETLEIVNSTPRTYVDVAIWINQRYTQSITSLPAGHTVKLSLWDFYDERGEVFSAGGLLRTEAPTPVRLVEIQLGPDEPLIGLVAITSE